MEVKDVLQFLKCNAVKENYSISRWYDSDDANQDTILSLLEGGVDLKGLNRGTLLRRRKQVYIDKIRWGARSKRRDCHSGNVVNLDLLNFDDVDVAWSVGRDKGPDADVLGLISEFSKRVNDSEARKFFDNLVSPSKEIRDLWKSRVKTNRTRNLEYIPPHSLLQMTGMSKSKYLKYRKQLIEFLKLNLEA